MIIIVVIIIISSSSSDVIVEGQRKEYSRESYTYARVGSEARGGPAQIQAPASACGCP